MIILKNETVMITPLASDGDDHPNGLEGGDQTCAKDDDEQPHAGDNDHFPAMR